MWNRHGKRRATLVVTDVVLMVWSTAVLIPSATTNKIPPLRQILQEFIHFGWVIAQTYTPPCLPLSQHQMLGINFFHLQWLSLVTTGYIFFGFSSSFPLLPVCYYSCNVSPFHQGKVLFPSSEFFFGALILLIIQPSVVCSLKPPLYFVLLLVMFILDCHWSCLVWTISMISGAWES